MRSHFCSHPISKWKMISGFEAEVFRSGEVLKSKVNSCSGGKNFFYTGRSVVGNREIFDWMPQRKYSFRSMIIAVLRKKQFVTR